MYFIVKLFRKIKILLINKKEHSNIENDIDLAYNDVSKDDIKSFFNNNYKEIENIKIWDKYNIYFNKSILK